MEYQGISIEDPGLVKPEKKELFDEDKVLHKIKHYLPSQTPLKDFIHHNTLHAFQDMKFYDAIFKASKIFGYQTTLQLSEYRELFYNGRIRMDVLERVLLQNEKTKEEWTEKLLTKDYDVINEQRIGSLRSNWNTLFQKNLDSYVHPVLFRILCSYLDQGISINRFPAGDKGFLNNLRELENNSFSSFFKTVKARQLLLSGCGISGLLDMIVGNPLYYEQYLFDQQFCHHGWSGLTAAVEEQPHTLRDKRKITLRDLITLELLLEVDALCFYFGDDFQPLCSALHDKPVDLFAPVPYTELNEVFTLWQEAFEWSYYDEVLAGISANTGRAKIRADVNRFQAILCIDERECSFRRHIETVVPDAATYGAPGFFGVEFYFQAEGARFYDKLCPAPVTPKYLIKEYDAIGKREHELLYSKSGNMFLVGYCVTLVLGFLAAFKLFLNQFRPKMSPAISNAFTHMDQHSRLTIENKRKDDIENGLQVGFTLDEMAGRVEAFLRGIGLLKEFSNLVYVIAHGSSSANNPHHSAHDCGACSGKPGSVNARVMAFMANHKGVRTILQSKGICIPETTQFVGSLHDTSADMIVFYDEPLLTLLNRQEHALNKVAFEKALDLNAKERSRRFVSINTRNLLKKVRKDIQKRSVSLFEPRPELGHGTNSLCIVGRRDLTRNVFLDRRAFLNSYDHRTDPTGDVLINVMKPVGLVCGGINLEYYFSRVDNHKLGAGTKLPHNVMGLVGVANSCDGDLRPGLPLQMIEVHDPVRLLVIVEHYPDVVLKAVQASADVYEWYINGWVHLMALHPDTNQYYYFKEGDFIPYNVLNNHVEVINDVVSLVENSRVMATNLPVDSTEENLPVYLTN